MLPLAGAFTWMYCKEAAEVGTNVQIGPRTSRTAAFWPRASLLKPPKRISRVATMSARDFIGFSLVNFESVAFPAMSPIQRNSANHGALVSTCQEIIAPRRAKRGSPQKRG